MSISKCHLVTIFINRVQFLEIWCLMPHFSIITPLFIMTGTVRKFTKNFQAFPFLSFADKGHLMVFLFEITVLYFKIDKSLWPINFFNSPKSMGWLWPAIYSQLIWVFFTWRLILVSVSSKVITCERKLEKKARCQTQYRLQAALWMTEQEWMSKRSVSQETGIPRRTLHNKSIWSHHEASLLYW